MYRLCALLGTLVLLGENAAMLQTQSKAVIVNPALLTSTRAGAASVNSSPSTVEPFALRQVELLASPFKAAMERNAKYLLELDADRLLHNTRKYAGLPPKGALYGGWEARGIAGHTLGHYLTALSQQYAATGDTRFRERIAYIIKEMAECQRAYGDGYIGALPPRELQTLRGFKEGKVDVQGSFNFKGGAWVPWYTDYHEAIMRPLLEGRDELAGKHANTQIPKVIGEARLYEVAGDGDGRKIAENFWEQVVNHHSYVIGGNSENEHFGLPDDLSDHLGPATAESCNTYNMLKLTRHLFEWQPKAEYFDFYERALYNHILGSQEPERGMFTYFMSLKPGHFKTYSTPAGSFWCCVGSGMENHTKYNDSIYFHGMNSLYVNLFIPSRLTWEEKGLVLEQKTAYPRGDRVGLRFAPKKPLPLSLIVRTPRWASGGLRFLLNGKPLRVASVPGSYAEIRRTWKTGDVLQVTIPMGVRTEAMPDDPNKVAFLYGPVVLAVDLGRVPEGETVLYAADQGANFRQPVAEVPVLVTEAKDLANVVELVSGIELVFRTVRTAQPPDVTLRPFNETTTITTSTGTC